MVSHQLHNVCLTEKRGSLFVVSILTVTQGSFTADLLPYILTKPVNFNSTLFWFLLILLTLFLYVAIYSLSINKHAYSILEADFTNTRESGHRSDSKDQFQEFTHQKSATHNSVPRQLAHPSRSHHDRETEFIKKAKEIVSSKLTDPAFGIQELAGALHLSQSQLNRKFNEQIGCPSSIFIRSLRLREAAKMLEQSDHNISEIAYRVGFKDSGYFSRVFKQHFGNSPTVFRNNC